MAGEESPEDRSDKTGLGVRIERIWHKLLSTTSEPLQVRLFEKYLPTENIGNMLALNHYGSG